MAKLLNEFVDFRDLSVLEEDISSGDTNQKKYYKLKGVFLQSETKNRNGRIYPKTILEREVIKYNDEKIKTNRAVGECDHPSSPQINLDRISHVIESLSMEGNDGIGVLRLIDTPMGKIVQTLVSEKILLGVSTRGVGSLEGEFVKDDFQLITPADVVYDPSASKAFVESVLENKEWILQGDQWVNVVANNAISNLQKSVDAHYDVNSNDALNFLVNRFLSDMNNNNNKHKKFRL